MHSFIITKLCIRKVTIKDVAREAGFSVATVLLCHQ
nr:LacI family DNA-binding transcriptional regulator [Streptococcus equi]